MRGTRSERSQEHAIKYTAIKSINLDNSPDSSRLQTEQAYKAMAPNALAGGVQRMATEPAVDTRLRNVQRHSIDLAIDDSLPVAG